MEERTGECWFGVDNKKAQTTIEIKEIEWRTGFVKKLYPTIDQQSNNQA